MKKTKIKVKTIKGKILVNVMCLIVISLVAVGSLSLMLSYFSTQSLLKQNMKEVAEIAAERVEWELKSYTNVVFELGSIARLSNSNVSIEDKKQIIQQKIDTYNMISGDYVGLDGISLLNGNDYKDTEYFQAAVKGETYISEPLDVSFWQEPVVVIAAPLWKDGIPNTQVVGVVMLIPYKTFLSDIAKTINVGENGYA